MYLENKKYTLLPASSQSKIISNIVKTLPGGTRQMQNLAKNDNGIYLISVSSGEKTYEERSE